MLSPLNRFFWHVIHLLIVAFLQTRTTGGKRFKRYEVDIRHQIGKIIEIYAEQYLDVFGFIFGFASVILLMS